jgi:two-component system chemotaxis response regulator CheY
MDNSDTIRKVVQDCVEDLGYLFAEADNGRDGLDKLAALDDVAMVVLDWNMPIMSGRETLRNLRDNEKTKDLKILVLIKIEHKDQVMEAIELGATNYMLKPFRVNALQDKIEELMTNAV